MLWVLCPLCGFLALPNHIPSKASFPLETSSPIENKLKKCKDYTTTGHCQPFTSPHLLTSPIQNLFPSTSVTSIHHVPPSLFNSLHASTLAKLLTSLQQGCFGRFLGKEEWSTSDILRRKRFVQRTQSTEMSCAPPPIYKAHQDCTEDVVKMARIRK